MEEIDLREIKEGAIFVADAHYPHHGDDFLTLLNRLISGEIDTPQLFLMGDIFDLLFGYNSYIQTFSADAIALLRSLSQQIEIYYFEGNHDFLIKDIFSNIKVYSRDDQPQIFRLDQKRVALSHGDKYALGIVYDLYCRLLRNRYLLILLRPFEKQIIDDRMVKLSQKSICHPMEHFDERVEDILQSYRDVDLTIEGHYHQAKIIGEYISLPSLACQNQIAVARGGEIVFESLFTLD
ncbi:MAG: metallophosphoesterase [Campylobacterota bacterium]|nr:metallophosphoesterase [Campylobacterota bacterium]